MKRLSLFFCLALLLLLPGCFREIPSVAVVTVQLIPDPDSPVTVDLDGLEVRLQNKNADFSYTAHADAAGRAVFEVQPGKYDVVASAWFPTTRIAVNGASGEFLLLDAALIEIQLHVAIPNPLIIREIYFHGSATPEGANYTKDTYVELYNNAGPGGQTVYLDSLCLAAVYPYNSTTGNNAWAGRDTIPIAQMYWMFPGDGHTYPLAPGESAVVACMAAVDHSGRATSGLALNRAHFGCWSETLPRHEIAAGVVRVPGDILESECWRRIYERHDLRLVRRVPAAGGHAVRSRRRGLDRSDDLAACQRRARPFRRFAYLVPHQQRRLLPDVWRARGFSRWIRRDCDGSSCSRRGIHAVFLERQVHRCGRNALSRRIR